MATACFSAAHFQFVLTTPLYLEALGGTDAEIGLIFGALGISLIVVRPFAGRLIQRWGARPVMTLAFSFLLIAAGAFGVASSVLMIFVARMCTGVYNGLYSPASNTYAADIAPLKRRGTAMGIFTNANILGSVAGPPLTLALLEWGGARPLEGALAGLLGRTAYRLNFFDVFLVSAVLAAIGLACTRFMRPSGASAPRVTAVGRGWNGLFSRPAIFPAAVSACAFTSNIAITAFLPLMARRNDLGNYGLYFALQALASVAVRFATGPISDRRGSAVVVVPALLLMVAGSALLAFSTSSPLLYLAGIVWGLGNGAVQVALIVYLLDRIPQNARGLGLSTYTLGQDLAISLGGAMLGILLQATNFRVLYLVSALIVLAGVGIFVVGNQRAWLGKPGPD